MDILLLRTFMAIVNAGSFSAAAADLNCVQSNVTARIRRLEDHLGQSVFERGRGGARLTDFGAHLRRHAEDLIARFEAAENDLLDAGGASAPLKIGSMETTAAVRLPLLLKKLKQQCPTAPITLRTGPTGELLSLLQDRKLDVIFAATPVDETRFYGVPAFQEHLTMAEPMAEHDADISPTTLLAFRNGCSYRAQAETWLRSLGKTDTEVLEMGSMESILGCVEAGMGFAIAPESSIHTYKGIKALKTRRLPAPYADMDINMIWRADHKKTRAHQALCDMIEGDA